jgi:RB1-inducible coiled-coil protein 1
LDRKFIFLNEKHPETNKLHFSISCNTGDIVLVLWDEEMNNYVILQDSSTLYFLHSDCVEALGLSTSASTDEVPRKMYCLAQVVKKEYCFARKVRQ